MKGEPNTATLAESVDEEIKYIDNNREERNKKYTECMSSFKEFLRAETEQLESTEADNTHNKELISSAFENTFERVLNASDLTIRKIKQTFNQKKVFWDNVIKMNSDVDDIELKKEFYLQKRNAEEGYLEAVDRQKDKHKSYKALIMTQKKKEGLRDYQMNNRVFEEKVAEGTNTMQQWQKMATNTANMHVAPRSNSNNYHLPETRGILNQFMDQKYMTSMNMAEGQPLRSKYSVEVENGTSFLNNFQRKV